MLTSKEKTDIIDCYIQYGNVHVVATKLRRSLTTVTKVLKNQPRKVRQKPAVKKFIDKQLGRRIKWFMSRKIEEGHVVTSTLVKKELSLTCSTQTIRNFLKSRDFVFKVMKQVMKLTPHHKEQRVNFAADQLAKNEDYERWIFSDEKKFNGDGPDNLGTYVFKNRPNPDRQKRQCGGISIMIIGCISANGKMKVEVSKFVF